MSVPRALRALAWPLLAWLVAHAALAAVAAIDHLNPFATSTWARFDSFLYLAIARDGYSLVRCDASSGFPSGTWCGTAGWFPLYPALVALGAKARVPPELAALVWSAAFDVGTLVLVWRGFLGSVANARNLALLLFAAAFPGFVYRHAVFPISAALFFATATLLCLERRRIALGAGAAFLLQLAHSAVAPLAVVWAIGAFVSGAGESRRTRVLRALALGGASVAGYAAVQLVMRVTTGHWDAYFRVAGKYGLGLHNPFATAWWWLHISFSGLARTHPAVAVQLVLVVVIVALLLRETILAWRSADPDRARLLTLALFVLAIWPLPFLLGNGVSIYRADALLMPAVLGFGRLPRWAIVVLAAASLGVGAWLGDAFFRSEIV